MEILCWGFKGQQGFESEMRSCPPFPLTTPQYPTTPIDPLPPFLPPFPLLTSRLTSQIVRLTLHLSRVTSVCLYTPWFMYVYFFFWTCEKTYLSSIFISILTSPHLISLHFNHTFNFLSLYSSSFFFNSSHITS